MTTTTTTIAPVVPRSAALRPLGLDEVRITGGYWHRLQQVNAAATLPHNRHWLEREGWLPNFDLAAAGTLPEGRRGREFSDSEVYKYLEGVAWEIGRSPASTHLEDDFVAVVARVAAAQEPDGYLNTKFGRPGQGARWSDLEWGHELYNFGHLFQAAVARIRTRPDARDGLVDVARRAADLVCDTFGTGGIERVCGHAEVETGLAELGRALGEPRYLAQARLFIERRGTGTLAEPEWGRAYFQDDIPVRDATVLRGHAVRANYLASGAADVADETGDDGLAAALRTQWDAAVSRRTYLTGGQGSHHQDEGFGADWELPPDRAYSETCAAVASIQFSWRLLLAHPQPRYADLIERTLFNVVATSPAEDGRSFFYANPLQQREPGVAPEPDGLSPRASSSVRAPWFEVSCCPGNVARTLASLGAYLATKDASGVQLHQYASSRVRTVLENGTPIELQVETDYPVDGRVRITVLAAASFRLGLRVPAWASGASVTVGDAEPITASRGFVAIERHFAAGDTVVLDLPIAPRITRADPRIDAVRDSAAIERGPVVYALESVDTDAAGLGADLGAARLDPSHPISDVDGRLRARIVMRALDDHAWPYGPAGAEQYGTSAEVDLVPYSGWAERGPSTMRVWIPLAEGNLPAATGPR